jgi:hypothetical protein
MLDVDRESVLSRGVWRNTESKIHVFLHAWNAPVESRISDVINPPAGPWLGSQKSEPVDFSDRYTWAKAGG